MPCRAATAAVPLWEAVVGEEPGRAGALRAALFGEQRAAWRICIDIIARSIAPNAAFALGLWIADDRRSGSSGSRRSPTPARGNIASGSIEALPFARPMHDLALLLLRLRVLPTGAPAAPAGRAFWIEVFEIGGQRHAR